MKIALAQINPTVGDFAGNTARILDFAARAAAQGADLVLFPELAICGYPPADFLEKRSFLHRASAALEQIAAHTAAGPAILVGTVLPADAPDGKHVRNVAALLSGGGVAFLQQKMLLPFYDVFDEQRYFEPATHQTLTVLDGQPLAITICEDAWNDKGFWPRRLYAVDPVEQLMRQVRTLPDPLGRLPRIILNISASPFWCGKRVVRRNMLAALARRHNAFVVMVNQVGGNDSLVFDGSSLALAPTGEVIVQVASFTEDLLVFDTTHPAGAPGSTHRVDPGTTRFARPEDLLLFDTTDPAGAPGSTHRVDPGTTRFARPEDLLLFDTTDLAGAPGSTHRVDPGTTRFARPEDLLLFDTTDLAGAPGSTHRVDPGNTPFARPEDLLLFDTTDPAGAPGSTHRVDPGNTPFARPEDLLVFDTTDPGNTPLPRPQDTAHNEKDIPATWDALVLGTRDYVRKCGFAKALIGLSGGIDSALVAAIAVEALGPENVLGIGMPSEFSSSGSIDDARDLAANLGIRFELVAIHDTFMAYQHTLEPLFAGTPFGLAEENLQSRIRGGLLMALSNKFGALVLTTGNKSEMSTGYCTLYGDMVGALAVLGDVMKTRVYALSHYANRHRELIPANTIAKPPSAELRPGQRDTDSLPPYDILDPILEAYVERFRSAEQIVHEMTHAGHPVDLALVRRVLQLVERSEYKRQQAAPVLKVTQKSFGNGRRFPIAVKVEI